MPQRKKILTLLTLSAIAVVCLTYTTTVVLGDDSPIPFPSYVPPDLVEHLNQIECFAADSDSLSVAGDSVFIDQLRQLPPLVDSGCPRHWSWGGRGGLDPDNLAHVEYARIAGGVIAHAPKTAEVVRAIQVVQKARAGGVSVHFGLRVHPFKGKFWRPGGDLSNQPPTYDGPEVSQEITKLQGFLLSARKATAYQQVDITRVFIDSETFQRDSLRATNRPVWNAALRAKHAAVVAAIHGIFPNAVVEFYNASPIWKCTALDEGSATASLSLYEHTKQKRHKLYLAETIAFQHARRLPSTTAYIALGAGFVHEDGKRQWTWEFDDDGTHARKLAKLLTRFDTRSVHHVVDYTAFDDRAIHWEKHVLIYFTALLESAR